MGQESFSDIIVRSEQMSDIRDGRVFEDVQDESAENTGTGVKRV